MTQAAASSAALPVWAETVRQKYLAGEASVFVLYRNVFDRYPANGTALSLVDFPPACCSRTTRRPSSNSASIAACVIQGSNVETGNCSIRTWKAKGWAAFSMRWSGACANSDPAPLLIPYAGTLFPATEPHFLSIEERAR
jgi:transitional endoplasmic reticulum ATPase